MKKKETFCPGCHTRDKKAPLLSRTGVPGWETGITAVSQPGQINVFVVVCEQVWNPFTRKERDDLGSRELMEHGMI